MQEYIYNYSDIKAIIDRQSYKNILVVCSKSLLNSFIINYLKENNCNIHIFTGFNPNPKYDEILNGINMFEKNNCDFIIAIGGGSAIDIAKAIKAFSTLNKSENYLQQKIIENDVKLLAVPTTAGTGSESTNFAVIYFNGNKYSIDDKTLLPEYVLLESKFLESLPLYQKKSTLLDALCQAIESYWSINSTIESKKYASYAIKLILDNYKKYINENMSVYNKILRASNYSGKAINISKTTAAHAMSYKITSLYGISHGHAVALTLPHIWEYMINNVDKCTDPRGIEYLNQIFNDLDLIFECSDHISTLKKLKSILNDISLNYYNIVLNENLDSLVSSVNENRLKNNPIYLDKNVITNIYCKLLKK